MLILFIILMLLMGVILAIAAVAMVIGVLLLVLMLIQAVAAIIGISIAMPYIIDWMLDTVHKAYAWVYDRVILPTARKLGYACAWVFVKLGLGEWAIRAGERLLGKLDALDAPDQKHDEHNHRDGDENPNQRIQHNRSSLP